MVTLNVTTSAITLPRILLAGLLVILAPFIHFLYKAISRARFSPTRHLKGLPRGHWFFGSLSKDQYKHGRQAHVIQEGCDQFGPVWNFTFLSGTPYAVLADPKAVTHVLLKPYRYQKDGISRRLLSTFFGQGLLAAEGDQHKRQRRVASPAFTQAAVDALVPFCFASSNELVTRWNAYIDAASQNSPELVPPQGPILNLFGEYARVALDIIGAAGFGYEFSALKDEHTELGKAFENMFAIMGSGSLYSLFTHLFPAIRTPGRILSKEQRSLAASQAVVHRISEGLLEGAKQEARKEAAGKATHVHKDSFKNKDLLSLLGPFHGSDFPFCRSRDDFDRAFLGDLCAEQAGFRSAGARTLASRELVENAGWNEGVQSLDALPYLEAVTREAMRRHPAVALTKRAATEHDTIPLSEPIGLKDGTTVSSIQVAPGDVMVLPFQVLNLNKEVWGADADEFRPERWLDEGHEWAEGGVPESALEFRHGWSSMYTFSAGPRACIGLRMALYEFKAILATMTSHFGISPPNLAGEPEVEIDSHLTVIVRPYIKDRFDQGFQLPVRIRRLGDAEKGE